MSDLDLTLKKVITVTGSSDHIINAVARGATDITTFDINPLTKYYMDLKLAAIRELSLEEFMKVFLYDTDRSFDYEVISSLEMDNDSKKFWLDTMLQYGNNGRSLRESRLFNTKYFNPGSKLWENLYLTKDNYEYVKRVIKDCKIKFIGKSLQDLELKDSYDYMFLSNIADYLKLMYKSRHLVEYRKKINKMLEKVNQIYFAYLYDIGNCQPRSEIDDLDKVRNVFGDVEIKTFISALEMEEDKKDGVLILRRR